LSASIARWDHGDVPHHPTVELLGRVPLFEGLSRANLSRIAVLAEEVTYNAGRVIVKKGDPGKAFYVIVEGTAKVVKGRIVTAKAEAELGAGQFFGELSLLDGLPRVATVVAATPLRTIRLERSAFRRLLREDPDLGLKILEGMSRRIRRILAQPPL
jgi:CRP-like cAMP-binding protein